MSPRRRRDAGGVPTAERCREILREQGVPPHICRHSEQVACVTRELTVALLRCGEMDLDPDRVTAAALLHDIAKADCLGNRRDHALEGGRLLRDLGLPQLATLVERHVRIGSWDPAGDVTEAEVLNYSDKRVRHEEIVTLAERFRDLLQRYGRGDPRAEATIRENWEMTAAMERKIFQRLEVQPEDLEELLAQAGC